MEGHPIHHKRMTVLAKLETKPFNRAHKAVELGIKELATVDPVWHDLYYSGNRSSIQQVNR